MTAADILEIYTPASRALGGRASSWILLLRIANAEDVGMLLTQLNLVSGSLRGLHCRKLLRRMEQAGLVTLCREPCTGGRGGNHRLRARATLKLYRFLRLDPPACLTSNKEVAP